MTNFDSVVNSTPTDGAPLTNAYGWDSVPPGRRDSGAGRRDRERRSGTLAMLREAAIIVVSALVLSWLIKSLLVQAFFIPSASMEDTLIEGDRVMVSRLTPGPFDLQRGDIVVFKDPGGWLAPYVAPDRGPVGNAITSGLTFVGLLPQDTGEHLIKRVIGLPGDHVVCCDADGRVSVNDVSVDESSYIAPGSVPSQDPFDQVVPEGMLWVMGDNRQNSKDSRYNGGSEGGGFVPVENVVGVAFATVWPFERATWHTTPARAFLGVPEAGATATALVRRQDAVL